MKFLKLNKLLKFVIVVYIFRLLNYSDSIISHNSLNTHVKEQINLIKFFESQNGLLQEVNCYLQYLAQIYSKNKIACHRIKDFILWIRYHQNIILEFEDYKKLEMNNENLYNLMLNLNLFIKHLVDHVKNKFSNLENFTFYKSKQLKEVNFEQLNSISNMNLKSLEILKYEVNNIGLTNFNKLVRNLDLLNDKYKITSFMKYSPLVSLYLAAGIYFIPKRFFQGVPILENIKDFLGSSNYTYVNENSEKQNIEKDLGSFFNIFNSSVIAGLSFVTKAYFSDTPLSPYTKALRDIISNHWKSLKGFKVDDIMPRGEIINDVTLDDERLIGLDTQIQELYKLVNYLVDPEFYDKSNTSLDKGVLLVGPSRNGKTFAARALCGTLNKAMKAKGFSTQFVFRELKPSDLIGFCEDGFKKILEQAKRDAPCVLFIDEIHNLPLQAKEWGGNLLTAFLTEMSGIKTETDALNQIIILGATDKPYLLDKALLQPGRFGNIIYFEKPNYENRKKYFEINLRNAGIDIKNIDIDLLVRQTQNCSYGDLEYVIKNAFFTARNSIKQLSQEMLQEQINKHVYKLRKELNLTPTEKKHIAAHQAGHALLYLLLEPVNRLELVTIAGSWCKIKEFDSKITKQKVLLNSKSTKYDGVFTYCPSESLNIEDFDEKIKLAKIKLAGACAERVLLGSEGTNINLKENTFHKKDKIKALNYLKSILLGGIPENKVPKVIKKELEFKAYNMLLELELEVTELLNKYKDVLEKITYALEEKTYLMANDVKEIIQLN